ncbi:MAG TPA: MoaD/ThiS family protein [Pseudomonadales bacterium]
MVRVVFPNHLLSHTGGEREVEVAARNVRELLEALERRFPGSRDALRKSAVAIDGQIYQDAFLEPLEPGAEVFFMQRIEGG